MRILALPLFLCCFSLLGQTSTQLDSLKTLQSSTGNDSIRYETDLEIGYLLLYDNPDTARIYFQDALEIAQKTNDQDKIARSFTLTGVTYYFNGQLDNAIENYLEALPISEKLGNDRYSGIIANNIGAVYFDLKDYEKTKTYYEKAVGLFKVAQDTFWLSNALNNLGNVLEKEKEYKESLVVYNQSLDLARRSKNEEAIGSAMSNIGNVHLGMKNYDDALKSYQEGLKRQLVSEDKIGTAISYNNIGQIFSEKRQWQNALSNHKKALIIAEELNHLETVRNSNKWLSDTYKNMGQYQKAFSYQEAYLVLSDSISGLEKTSLVEELDKKYETEKKDKQITVLELEKKNAALVLAKSENQRNVLIAVSLIVVVVAILLFVLFRQKRKSLEERDILLKEIHHRVKNNLQVISSLLNLQADSLDDDTAKYAVKEGQLRVKSMALIHQKLYSADDVRGVNVQDYLEQLCSELFKAFGVDQEKVASHINTSGLKLDIDTVIPLGLIINELITNSLKYAFQKTDSGLLEISMKEEEGNLVIVVKDNGAGMDEEAMKSSNSFGWKMIKSLSRKLKADISVSGESGTKVQLRLARYKLVT
jgi:two-component system, sensor histidine kinase PdtaS